MDVSADLFQPLHHELAESEALVRPSLTYWQDAWRRLKKGRLAMAGLVIICLVLSAAVVGPWVSPYAYSDQDLSRVNEPPSRDHWFGTDDLGRDVLVRVLYGARISLAVGFVASFINLTVGLVYGGISGFFGGRLDNVMMRIVDVLYGVPLLLIVIILMVVFQPGLRNIFLALGLVYWLTMARIVRGQILSLKENEFVLAARTIGASRWRVLFRHLLPNCMGPVIITMTMSIPQAIFTEAFLSFIGLGVSAPMASWGMLASDALPAIKTYPWQLFFPSLAICVTMLAFNFLGDGLRDALDPRLRK